MSQVMSQVGVKHRKLPLLGLSTQNTYHVIGLSTDQSKNAF